MKEFVTNLSQVVKVVFASNPAVSCCQALGFIGDVTHIKALAVEEFPFKQLDTHKDRCVHRDKKAREHCNLNIM